MAPTASADSTKQTIEVSFLLPDRKTRVSITEQGDSYVVYAGGQKMAAWISDRGTSRVSQAMVLDERACFEDIRRLALHDHQQQLLVSTWTAIYALWLHPSHRNDDLIPIAVSDQRIVDYLCYTGLGRVSPFEKDNQEEERLLWLAHEAFWQGAGTPNNLSWLRARPEMSFDGINSQLGVFGSQLSFTRKSNVCAVHPLRPPKPAPGSVIYSRFIVELDQHLEILHIDADNEEHFEAYCRWQNSDRVNSGWKERGPEENHRAYLTSQLADPHSMSCIFLWDRQPAGYCELGWAKEDNMACFVGANCGIVLGEFDQNSHILVGEERYRGGKRYQAVATSIKHTCFLRDPRTQQVVAEPRIDLSSVPIQDRFLPQEKKKRFQLPHKEAMLFCLRRDRFFQEAHFV